MVVLADVSPHALHPPGGTRPAELTRGKPEKGGQDPVKVWCRARLGPQAERESPRAGAV